MRLLFIFLFSVFSTLYSSEIEEVLTPSTPQQLSLYSNSPNALIAGLVDPQSRKLSLSVTDLVVKGAQPLRLQRFYTPSPIPDKFDQNGKKDLYQLFEFYKKYPFQDWSFLAHKEIHEISYNPHKKKKKGFKESIYYVPHPNGTTLTFWKSLSSGGGLAELQTPLSGMTNIADEMPLGSYHPKNTSLQVSNDRTRLDVTAPDGTIRFYRAVFTTPRRVYEIREGIAKQTSKFILEEERLPNGKRIIYEWDKRAGSLKSIHAVPARSSTPYGSIHLAIEGSFDREKKITFTSSSGQLSLYCFQKHYGKAKGEIWDEKKKKYHDDKGGRELPFFLKQVISPFYPNELLEDDGRLLLKHYTSRDYDFECLHILDSGNPAQQVIKKLLFSNRAPFTVREEKGETIVDYANDSSTRYTYDKECRIASIAFFEDDSLKKTKNFSWSPEGFLLSEAIKDTSDRLLKETSYTYKNDFGNPVTETLTGNLTGDDGEESYTIRRTFDRHLLREEKEESGLTTRYEYLDETNLIKLKLTLFGENIVQKECCKYDADYNLIEKIVDNGNNERTRSEYILYPISHLPEWIIERYDDGKEEFLIKKKRLFYDKYNNVKREEIYDAKNNYVYSLEKIYDPAGRLTSETNPLGQRAFYTYDEKGQLEKKTNFSGRLTTKYAYDGKKRLIEKKEAPDNGLSHVMAYDYDLHDHLISETDPLGNFTKHVYDPITHKPIQTTSPDILSVQEDPVPVITSSHYDCLGNELRHVDSNGYRTTYTYNIRGQVTSILHPDGSKETMKYTPAGHLASHINQEGVVTAYIRDPWGRILTKTILSSSGEEVARESFEYNAIHILRKTDREGYVTTYTYDGAGRKIGEERSGRLVTFAYDDLGRVETIIQHNGTNTLVTHFKRDLLDRVLEKTHRDLDNNSLSKITYTYDADGNKSSITRYPENKEATEIFSYDPFTRLTRHIDPLGHSTTTTYDENFSNALSQRVLKTTRRDPLGISFIEEYDPYNRLVQKEIHNAALLHSLTKSYDPNGNLLEQKDHIYETDTLKETQVTHYTYSPTNQTDSLTRAFATSDAKTTHFTYTPTNQLQTKTLPDGTILTYSYIPLGYLESLTSSDESIHHTFAYNKLGELIFATDNVSNLSIQRKLDPFGNILQEDFPNNLSIQTSYDALDRPLSLDLSGHGSIEYNYDPLYLRTVTRRSPRGDPLYTHTYTTYDHSGNLLTETPIGNLEQIEHTLDLKGRKIAISSSCFSQTCSYDSVDNLTQTDINGKAYSYTYDELSQLTSEATPETLETYVNDSNYNQTRKNGSAIQHNTLNELLEQDSITCNYDLNGNLTLKITPIETIQYVYDPLNRMTGATTATKQIEFTYDPLGRRLSKKVSAPSRPSETFQENYLYFDQYELGTFTPSTPKHLRIPGLPIPKDYIPIAIELENKPYAPILDIQQNIRQLIDLTTQAPSHSYDYTAFGKTPSNTIKEPTFNPYRFATKRFDPNLNLYTFGKRLYDPTLSRWLTIDPAGFVDSMNLYAYVLNNPFRYLDPDGEEAIIAISLTALYSVWSTGGLTAAAAVIGTAALPVTLAVATGVAVGWAAHEIYKSNPNLARNLLNVHATASNGMYTPYYTFTPEMAKKAEKEKKNDVYAPDRPLPMTEDGVPVPDTDEPHTQLGTRGSKRRPGEKYPQAREFDTNSKPVKSIDFTDHGKSHIHPNPHEHPYEANPTGGTPQRGDPKPLINWNY